MGKGKSSALPARAWGLLRLALRRWLVVDIRHAVNHLKSLCTDHHHHHHQHYHRHANILHYGEHELSFAETPNFQFKTCHRRQFFPCIDPPLVSSEGDTEDDRDSNFAPPEEICEMDVESCDNDGDEREEGIDSKAEEFISKFYEEMKLERQESWLRYNEMLYRGISWLEKYFTVKQWIQIYKFVIEFIGGALAVDIEISSTYIIHSEFD